MVADRLADGAADRIFQALGAATRRDILVRAIRQEQSVSALARHYEMSFAAVQKHVAKRKAAALLDAYEQLWIERTTQIAEILAGEEGSTT